MWLRRVCSAVATKLLWGKGMGWAGSDSRDRAVALEEIASRNVIGKAMCQITFAMFSTLYMLMKDSQLYTLKDEELRKWPK